MSNKTDIAAIWVYLSATPLMDLTIGLSYRLYRLYRRANSTPFLNPVAVSIALLTSLLMLTNTRYEDYFAGGQFVHFLLGPATIALAIPLYYIARLAKEAHGMVKKPSSIPFCNTLQRFWGATFSNSVSFYSALIRSDSDLGDKAVSRRYAPPLLNKGHRKCFRKYKNKSPFNVSSKLKAVSMPVEDNVAIVLIRWPLATGCSS